MPKNYEDKSKSSQSYLKKLMKKTKKAVNLVLGNPEDYLEENIGGDLRFDSSIMMKINITFDENFLPHEKVLKLNLRGSHFFSEIKRDIREINGIFIVYPSIYAFQLDTRKDEWEKKLLAELNDDYDLELFKIRFVNEEEICSIYQQAGFNDIRNPYRLKEGELLIVAGGFANFNTEGTPLCSIKVEVTPFNEPNSNIQPGKKIYKGNYYAKFTDKAGGYFYVGGEWYHNLFVPEFFFKDENRFFSFRIADDGKNLKFFGDNIKRGIDIRGKVTIETLPFNENIIHLINPEYLAGTQAKELVLTVSYEIEFEDEYAMSKIKAAGPLIQMDPRAIEEKDKKNLPFLENSMILLPAPNADDIPSYLMTIGDDKKGLKFYASSRDQEISILHPSMDAKIYKRHIKDKIDYSIKLGNVHYSISDDFIARFTDKELKTYFSWALSCNLKNRFTLAKDFYIFGREPLGNPGKVVPGMPESQLIRLNEGNKDFWRIGTSRNHAFLLKTGLGGFRVYNISPSFPVFVVKKEDREKPLISPFRICPITDDEKREKLEGLLADLGKGTTNPDALAPYLKGCAEGLDLENNDYMIIGNRVYKYIIPLVMESELSSRVQMSVLRKIRESTSVFSPEVPSS
ncbi:MAG: hypothetical protein MUF15_05455 [Acidobacteria bacterium]|jgi:hypothetical protein|nr:hypothetical protein [Acidobacteriota bacterium]